LLSSHILLPFPTRRSSDLSSSGLEVSCNHSVKECFSLLVKGMGLPSFKSIFGLGSFSWLAVFAGSFVAFDLKSSGFKICSASLRSEEHTSELQSRENLVCR